MGEKVQSFLEFTDEGSKFVFGEGKDGFLAHPVAFKVRDHNDRCIGHPVFFTAKDHEKRFLAHHKVFN